MARSAPVAVEILPLAVVARGVACDQVNLRWLPPSSDTLPARYDVYRDGTLIGSSEAPQYVDRDPQLLPSTRYEYFVVARREGKVESPRSSTSIAQTLAEGEGFYEVLFTGNPPVIDGDLDEFTGAWPALFATPSTGAQVVFRALWDEVALYVAYAVTDTDLLAICTEADNGLVWNDDSVELFLDLGLETAAASANAEYMDSTDYQLILNLLNVRYDLRGNSTHPAALPEPSLWNGDWQSAVGLQGTLGDPADVDEGYVIEASITWSSLGEPAPTPGHMMGMSFTVSDADAGGVFDWIIWPAASHTNVHQNSANWQAAVLSSVSAP